VTDLEPTRLDEPAQPTRRQTILKVLGIVLAVVLAALGGLGVAFGLLAS